MKARNLLKLLMMTLFVVATNGCTIGVKERVRVIYVGYFDTSPLNGAIKIATEKPIPVTIEGEKDIHTTKKLGGYYAISAQDLKRFLDALNK